ncbi:MAG: tetratricopeptide repeat protein [Gammaproteobacteria bacterium]|nr:tetratricopeptide repeat protein [Gammaproteobacteria bacterium]
MLNRIVFVIVFSLLSSLCLASSNAINSLQEGDKLYADGNIKDALGYFEKAVQENPDSSESWFKLARTQMLNNRYSDSVKSYQKTISIDQNNALAFVGMAISYMHMGLYNHAKASFNEASRIDPSKKAEVGKVMQKIEKKLKSMETATAKSSYMAH